MNRNQLFIRLSFLFCLFCFVSNSNAQISGGAIKPAKKKKKKKEKQERSEDVFSADSLSGTTYYFSVLGQRSFRTFEDQTSNDIHALLNDEFPVFTSGLRAGTVIPLSGKIGLEAGITYFGHGEGYRFEDSQSDSAYSYKNSYMQVGVPLKLRYTHGGDFQFFGFAGIAPLNILNIRSKVVYTEKGGTEQDLGVTSVKKGFTTFNLMASAGLGINYYFSDYLGVTFGAEFRRHLLNTYSEDTFKRNHRMFGYGLTLGLQVRL